LYPLLLQWCSCFKLSLPGVGWEEVTSFYFIHETKATWHRAGTG
jgi:hypothetical protein